MIRLILALGAMLAVTVTGRAEITKVKGKGEVVYKGTLNNPIQEKEGRC